MKQETSVKAGGELSKRRYIPEQIKIIHNHHCYNLKPYNLT
jgi:hypothetical protein